MRLSVLLHYPFQLFVRTKQIIIYFVHLLSKLCNFLICLIQKSTCFFDSILPFNRFLSYIVNFFINHLIFLFPSIHCLHLHLSWLVLVVLHSIRVFALSFMIQQHCPLICQSGDFSWTKTSGALWNSLNKHLKVFSLFFEPLNNLVLDFFGVSLL